MATTSNTTIDRNRSDNNNIMSYKRFVCIAIGVVTVPLLLKHYTVQRRSSIDHTMAKDHSSSSSSSSPSVQGFIRPFNNHLFSKDSTSSSSSSNMHRELFFLRDRQYCRPLRIPGDSYQTVTVLRLFSWFSRLFNPYDVLGTCGEVCTDICNHKPCFNDYESPDDELCECFSDGTYQCGANSFCGETTDACTCNAGYEGDAISGCVDINECRNDVCGPNGVCVNKPGTYSCDCNAGYRDTAPAGGCVDINECVVSPPCGPNSICSNTVGSFTCSCVSGYTGTPPSIFCTDIDECTTRAPCGANAVSCNNNPGSYTCTCQPGYRDTSPAGGCVNIDECATGTDTCNRVSENCVDTIGSFQCNCKSGYSGNAPNCADIDECATGTICGPNASCTNSIGSYRCACNAGFLGGSPPNCRKLNSFEKCPGPDSDCAPGLTCGITSRSDSSTSCCPTADVYRCNVNKNCCSGAYSNGQACPSGLDIDCKPGLICGRRSLTDSSTICCDTSIPSPFGGNRICV